MSNAPEQAEPDDLGDEDDSGHDTETPAEPEAD